MTKAARMRRVAQEGLLAAAALAAVMICGGSTAAAAAQADYTITMVGGRAGALRITNEALPGGGQRVVSNFSYRSNGRGPDVDERFDTDAAGTPVRYEVRGKATFGAEIREDFTLADGRLTWASPVDRGDESAEPGTLFLPLESSPAHGAQVLRALLARPAARAPAQSGALIAAEKLASLSVGTPAADVALYAVTGIGPEPQYAWLRDDASRALFAIVFPGWQMVAAGYEASGDALLERQQQAQTERLQALQRRLRQPLEGLTLIRAVRWFDAQAAVMRGPSDVYLSAGRISAITAPGAWSHAAPQQLIDGSGRTLLPGLIDMHAHLSAGDALAHLAGGVTTVRDLANDNARLTQLRAQIDRGEIAGPHVVAAGLIEGKSPFNLRSGIVAGTLHEALAAVDWYAARGYRQVKLYNSIKPEWVRPVAQRAHGLGLTVAGHVPAFMRAEEAVRAGYDELTHINQLMLNFLVKPADDTRTLLRFTLVGERARELREAQARRFLALLKQRGTTVDPTLATFEAMFTQRDGEPHPALGMVADHLPVLWRRSLKASEMSPTAEQIGPYRESWQRMLRFVGELHRAGVPLVAGTDFTPGFALHRELELYVAVGLTPGQALKTATWNAAHVAAALPIEAGRAQTPMPRRGKGRPAIPATRWIDTGSITPGHRADLLLVEGDPSRNISDIRRASLVIKSADGTSDAYAPAALYQALGIKPFVPAATVEKPTP